MNHFCASLIASLLRPFGCFDGKYKLVPSAVRDQLYAFSSVSRSSGDVIPGCADTSRQTRKLGRPYPVSQDVRFHHGCHYEFFVLMDSIRCCREGIHDTISPHVLVANCVAYSTCRKAVQRLLHNQLKTVVW